jgi:tetratricopeptide (TPR) repeat protein
LWLLLASFAAVAQDTTAPTDVTDAGAARQAFEMGQAAYDAGQYDEAHVNFAESYRLSGDTAMLLNMAAALEMQGAHLEALDLRKQFLSEGPADQHGQVRRDILVAAEAKGRETLAGDPGAAAKFFEHAFDVSGEPRFWRLRADAYEALDDYENELMALVQYRDAAAGGERRRVDTRVGKICAHFRSTTLSAPSACPDRSLAASSRKLAGWGTLGAGLAVTAAGTTLAVLSNDRYRLAEALGETTSLDGYRTMNTVGGTMAAVGGVAAATGLVLALIPEKGRRGVTFSAGPSSIGLVARLP